jgi:peroxiredoxin
VYLAFGLTVASGAEAITVSELPADVREVLTRTIETYKSATSYRDNARIEIRMKADDAANAHIMPVPITMERPNRVRLNLDVLAIQCDGSELVRYSRVVNRYTSEKAPPTLTIGQMFGPIPANGMELFLHLHLLTEPEPLALILKDAMGVVLEADETVDGRACHSVRYESPAGRLNGRLLIDRETGLLREFRLSADGKQASMPPGTPEWVSLKLADAIVNQPVEAETFAFAPPPEAVEVDDLTKPPAAQVAQAGSNGDGGGVGTVVGRTAPDFTVETLDGKEIKLSALRGQVVVLDFWAAWCGPCVRAFPFLERAHKSFAGKPVMFVGVCSDQRSQLSKIKSTVTQNGLTFPVALDREGRVAGAYKVQGFPTTMLIDQNGVIRSRDTGFSPYSISKLTQEITGLLGE